MNDQLETQTYYRGDSSAIGFEVQGADGTPADITGRTYRMTVSRGRHPSSSMASALQVAQFTGTIVDAAAGRVAFNPGTTAFDAVPLDAFREGVAELWYDVEETDGAAVHTFGVGEFLLKGDLSR